MTTSAVYGLINALLDRFDGAVTANVYDAFGDVTEDPGDYLVVGYEDPDSDRATSAESKQDWHGIGAKARLEEGTVTCLALSWNGNSDMRAARAGVKSITDAVEVNLRADPNLGGVVPGLMWTGYGVRTELIQIPATDGACAFTVFDVAFKARLT